MNKAWDLSDPFAEAREDGGVLNSDFNGEHIPLILAYTDVRAAAGNWQQFSSDTPFRVPVPSEEHSRSVRQLPIETDPPEHSAYRSIVQPVFARPKQADYQQEITELVQTSLAALKGAGPFDVINDFAFPLQTRALARLLGLPESHAVEWQSWGIQVLQGCDHAGDRVADYIDRQIERARREPAEDFFSLLVRAEVNEQALSRDEIAGFALLAFAGGRDTVISTLCFALAHLASAPRDKIRISSEPLLATRMVEEVVRTVSPLTMIGRTCPVTSDVGSQQVPAGHRVALCWASANRDPSVFEQPEEFSLDRKRNAHVGFGAGHHTCLGASHARLLLRSLILSVCRDVDDLRLHAIEPHYENWPAYRRQTGYKQLRISID